MKTGTHITQEHKDRISKANRAAWVKRKEREENEFPAIGRPIPKSTAVILDLSTGKFWNAPAENKIPESGCIVV